MSQSKLSPSDVPVLVIATGFGSGYSPIASGTAGSIVGVGIFLLIQHWPIHLYLLAVLCVTAIGIPISSRAEKIFGEKDSGKIVIDEIAGQLLALVAAPPGLATITAGFLLFRFFDIWKPFRKLENLNGGLGVMLDDIAAGLLAFLVLQGALLVV